MLYPTESGPRVEEQIESLHCFSYPRVARKFWFWPAYGGLFFDVPY